MKIVLVTQYFPPEIGATQSRLEAFARHLAGRGHDVTVVCEFPNHPHGRIPDRYRGKLVAIERADGYRVVRVWVKANPEKTQRTRMAFYVSYMAMASAVTPFLGRPDVVFATSPPLFAGLAGSIIGAITRAPFVLDVRDLWPAAAVSLGQIGTGRGLRVAEWIERHLYRRAAAVTAVTSPFCDHIDAIRGREPKTFFLPNGTLEHFFSEFEPLPKPQLGAPADSFVVMFAGTHGIAQALPSVLDAAALSNGCVHFTFVGEGPVKQALVERAECEELRNVSFAAAFQPADVGRALAASDVLLVPLSAEELFADFVPSKLLDYMATAKPIIVAARGESVRILETAGAGVTVPPEDPAALADAVKWLHDNPEEAHAMGQRGREYARRHLRSFQAERLEMLLESVVLRKPASEVAL